MTECIAVLIQSRNNPHLKALLHLDGDTLYDQEIARQNVKNVKKCLDDFEKQDSFYITAFGGREEAQSYRYLRGALSSAFNKDKIKFTYIPNTGYDLMSGALTLTSNGNYGLYQDCMRREGLNVAQTIAENKHGFTDRQPVNHKAVIFTAKDLQKSRLNQMSR